MGELSPVLLPAQSDKRRSSIAGSSRLLNCYAEPNQSGGQWPFSIVGSPGLKAFGPADFGTGPIRGMLFAFGKLFVVSGNRLLIGESDGTYSDIGLIGGSGRVSMIQNSTHVGIATTVGFYAATTLVLTAVDGNYYTTASYQDGYGILSLANSELFYITGLDDMLTIDPLDYSSSDTFADGLVGLISDHRELLLFGKNTVEGWYNAGDAYFPFVRTPGGFVEIGCAAAGSISKAENLVFWLADDRAVYQMAGYSPQKISTEGIEKRIAEMNDVSEAISFTYKQEAHEFYVLTFDDATFVYDISTGLWHERDTNGRGRWRPTCYAFAWDKHLVGDNVLGPIYELDLGTFVDGNELIKRSIESTPVTGPDRVFQSEMILDIETGVGTVGQGLNPVVMLELSDDGNQTWIGPINGYLGKIGEFKRRVEWHRLGSFFKRSFRISISDPVKFCIQGIWARFDRALQ